MRTNDTISGAILIIASLVMIYLTLSFPPLPGQKYGPALFPRVLGAGLLVCGALLVLRGLGRRRRGEAWATFADWTGQPGRVIALLLVVGLVLTYILLSEWIGFLPIAFALLLTLFIYFKTRAVVAVPIAIVATWSIHWFFATMMRVPLPRGLLTNIL
jgi:putative tricarboxylic transport membrane protein